jgi:6-phosphogluconate dehydrogenase
MTANQDLAGRWHLKKEIQLGHIITTITVALAATVYVQKIEQRLAVVESQISSQRERDDRQDKLANDTYVLLRQQLERMDAKLDRLVEKGKP